MDSHGRRKKPAQILCGVTIGGTYGVATWSVVSGPSFSPRNDQFSQLVALLGQEGAEERANRLNDEFAAQFTRLPEVVALRQEARVRSHSPNDFESSSGYRAPRQDEEALLRESLEWLSEEQMRSLVNKAVGMAKEEFAKTSPHRLDLSRLSGPSLSE
jgi:hypothetical protein